MASTLLFHCGCSIFLWDGAVPLSVLFPASAPAPQEPCRRSTQAIGQLLFHSSGHFSWVENAHLEGWSPGSEQPMAGRSHQKLPLLRGQ